MTAIFGPAGNSESFSARYKSSLDAPRFLREMGLDCYEYQCGRGVNIGEDTARALGERAREQGICLSVHSPYFINLSSPDADRREKNIGYILSSCRAAQWMGGGRVVVHCGGLTGQTREQALANTLSGLREALLRLEDEGLGAVRLCIETMGKVNVLGDLSEVILICRSDERLLPCIDFGHLNARTLGRVSTREELAAVLDALHDGLGAERARIFHAHFSKIEYSKGGEVKHLTFSDTVYGPDFAPLAALLAERELAPHIICESAGTQAEDALAMKTMYQQAVCSR